MCDFTISYYIRYTNPMMMMMMIRIRRRRRNYWCPRDLLAGCLVKRRKAPGPVAGTCDRPCALWLIFGF